MTQLSSTTSLLKEVTFVDLQVTVTLWQKSLFPCVPVWRYTTHYM